MRLVSWNILHGAGSRRTPLVALRLCDLAPDLVVLTEFRRTTGGQIAGVLHDRGLIHQRSTEPPAGRNGVFVASRTTLTSGDPGPGPWARHRWLDVGLPELGATLTAVHAPDTHRSDPLGIQRQAAFWQHLVRVCRRRKGLIHTIAGDLNTGRGGMDGDGDRFTGAVFLGRIATLGYRDAFRQIEPSAAAPTWFSHTGVGVRIDAVLVSAALSAGVINAWHEGPARAEKESDHAPVVVDLELGLGAQKVAPGPAPAKNTAKRAVRALAQPKVVR